MHGLFKAGLMLAPALASGIGATTSLQGNNPSAFITVDVPDVGLETDKHFLTLRVDVYESLDACGTAKLTINGEALPGSGRLSLPLVADDDIKTDSKINRVSTPTADFAWDSDCLSLGDQDREQLLRLRIVSVNGIDVTGTDTRDNSVAVHFRQTAPAHVLSVEGAASFFQFKDDHSASTAKAIDHKAADAVNTDYADDADLVAWKENLDSLHRSMALLQHDTRLRERYIAERFGPDALSVVDHSSDHSNRIIGAPCSKFTAFLGSVFHTITGTAQSLYDELVLDAFGDDSKHRHNPSPPPLPNNDLARQHSSPKHPHNPVPPRQRPHHVGQHTAADKAPIRMTDAATASDKPLDRAFKFRGRNMRSYSPDGPSPAETLLSERHNDESPRQWPPLLKTVFFFALIAIVLGFLLHGGKRMKERRESRRERHRRFRVSVNSFLHTVSRFFAGGDDHEKLLAAEAGAASLSERSSLRGGATEGHIMTNASALREQPPASSLEDEIAQFRAAADMVDQMIVAEEGRAASAAQSAEPRRRQEQRNERSSLSASLTPRSFSPPLAPAAFTARYNQSPPPPQSSRMYGGFDAGDPAGSDVEFDDTESLPPPYSSEDYQDVDLAEAHMVADGFQYRPGPSP
ncbi:hypothetical protein SEPCBS57363_005038 [Sporothrix epigloea]|uniref:Uncharacterized protein n=1 Tax=Sporothrix epigloea TaxID=1892477 RepID=A0ABP0DZ58_9PEZI